MQRIYKLLLLWCFLPLYVASQNADIEILRQINSSRILPSDKVFRFISDVHLVPAIGTPVIMGATALLTKNRNLLHNSLELGAATIADLGAVYILKHAIDRDRPSITYPDILQKAETNTSSFPSTHTAIAFTTATSLSLMYPKWYVIVPSYLWAGTMGYSRMYLGMHYPSDVLAGALIGSGTAWITHKANKWYQSKTAQKHGKYE
jgi:membrane-associated phospholipid phosphatase